MIVSNESATLAAVWVGIDVSKKSLDVAIWLGGKRYRHLKASNDESGIETLLDWATRIAGEDARLSSCMESTGDYHFFCALTLTEKGFSVSVADPARIKYFGIEIGRLTKTDKADAKLIAHFACERRTSAWH
ncbi:MAG: transposase [Fimbriimonadales bacterium]